jgi:hypothetical protein
MNNHVFKFSQWARLHESDEALTGQASKEGRNNPEWIALVAKLKGLSFAPKVLTFDSYDYPPIPSQSLNWGTAKDKSGKYALAISSTDSNLPKEEMGLFNSNDRGMQKAAHNWWRAKGYSTDGNNISIKFREASRLAADLEEFFTKFPPQ